MNKKELKKAFAEGLITKEKFQEVIKTNGAEVKIEMLSAPCALCGFYQKQHKKCIYYDRCKNRFENKTFRSAKEMDEFAKEEIEYLELLESWVWLAIDHGKKKLLAMSKR